MATLYKILILCVGFALSANLRAQSHLDPVNDSEELAERYGHSLLTKERKCGIVVEPSFSNRYGISLSTKCDSLTLIEKRPHGIAYPDSVNIKEIPAVKVDIDSVFGKSLAELIDVAVEKAMPTFSAGLDGVMYYFIASNDSIGVTWSPSDESSNCDVLVNIVETLKEAIQTGNLQNFIEIGGVQSTNFACHFKMHRRCLHFILIKNLLIQITIDLQSNTAQAVP